MVRYGTLDSSGRPVYAGTTLVVDGVPYANATRAMWLAAGKKPFIGSSVPPKSKQEDYHYERDGWDEQSNAIVPKWKLVEDAHPPRTFSKLRIVAALKDANVWDSVKAFIEQQGLYDLFLAAQDFSEENEYFVQGKSALQQQLGWTDEQVEAVLSAAEGGI